MTNMIFFNFENKLNKFSKIIQRLEFLSLSQGFFEIKTVFKTHKLNRVVKESIKKMKEQFVSNFKKKEEEISQIKNKIKNQEEAYSNLKLFESELLKNLNSKGKTLSILEQRKKPLPNLNLQNNDNSAKKIKFCEDKVFSSPFKFKIFV